MNFRSAPARPRLARLVRLGLAACSLTIGVAAAAPGAASAGLGAWKFQTASKLQPMQVQVLTRDPGTAPGDIFSAPFHDFAVTTPLVGQAGTLIMDNKGNPIWFRSVPAGQEAFDFQTQTLSGKPVLTWWQGSVILPPATPAGVPVPGQGAFYIYDQHYKQIAKITAQNGWTADPHEFRLTSQGTAIFPAVKEVAANLTKFNGSATGQYEDNEVQEVDLKTGKLVFSWDLGTHVPLSQARVAVPPAGVWDPYHINSIDEDSSGHLLISARSTWALYEVSHKTGGIIWQLGGTGETIKPGPNADFSWQHDAKFLPGNEISLFDDSCCNLPIGKPTRFARGLVLKIDTSAKTATYVTSYTHSPGLDVPTQGNTQLLPNGNVFMGWGQQPVYSEYTAKGRLLYDVSMPAPNESYRTLRQVWVGQPQTKPSVVAHRAGGRVTLYVSWNGATAVTKWKVLGGPGKKKLTKIKTVGRGGFETTIRFRSTQSKFEVMALSGQAKVLGTSALLKPTKPPAAGAASGTSVGTHKVKKLGTVLATSSGHTLYMFSKDAKNRSNCSSSCAKQWKPLLASGKVSAKSGVSQKLLGTIKLSSGKTQVVYNHHPLYTYVKDKKAGDLHGEDANQFGGRWYVVNTKGNSVKPKAGGVGQCNPLCTGY